MQGSTGEERNVHGRQARGLRRTAAEGQTPHEWGRNDDLQYRYPLVPRHDESLVQIAGPQSLAGELPVLGTADFCNRSWGFRERSCSAKSVPIIIRRAGSSNNPWRMKTKSFPP